MRGISGLADIFDAIAGRESPRRLRRKQETKVGEKFDDYFVHAPRRVVDPPPRGAYYDTSKHRSFDRPRTPRGHIPWKRTASAPRSLSEVTESHAARAKSRISIGSNSARSRSSLSLSRNSTTLARTPTQRFYAPNEKPVSSNRPHPAPPPVRAVPGPPPAPSIPATSLTDSVLNSSSNLSSPVLRVGGLASPRRSRKSISTTDSANSAPSNVSSPALRAPASASPQRRRNSVSPADSAPSVEPVLRSNLSSPALRVPGSPSRRHRRKSSLAATSLTNAVLTSVAPELSLPEETSQPAPVPAPAPKPVKKKKKKRPPALITSGVAHGFAAGGFREITPVPDAQAGPSVIPISPATSGVAGSAASASSTPERPQEKTTPERLSFPPKTARLSDIRLSDRSPTNSSTVSRRYPEDDRYVIEEAPSISSLGDIDTPSAIAAKNGIFPMERLDRNMSGRLDEVSEDVFVIGADGVFQGGGFVITKNGLLKSPGNLTRKLSNGTGVDGVPRSSNNLIIVRSLTEFSRGSTLSRRNKLDSTLGAGAAGRVSLAIHRPSGRKIAVKRINVFDVEKRNQLLKELETLMSYDSRFLVRSYGAFYDGEGMVHVTLEYMDRGALSDIVELRGRVPEAILVHIVEHCLRGLMFLHDNHVLHRDFKTSNILLSRRVCRAKLSDFGLARGLNPGESKTDSFVGTLAYMSPERLNGSDYTYASDIWGLGICVLECFLGRYPFPKPQSYFDYVEAARSNPSSLMKGASAACVDFVRLCTCSDPQDRPMASVLLQHAWIVETRRDANAFREWLEEIPSAHSGEGFDAEDKLQRLRKKADAMG